MVNYKIIGKHNFYPGCVEVYWEGNDIQECVEYLHQLRITTALCDVAFKIYEYNYINERYEER